MTDDDAADRRAAPARLQKAGIKDGLSRTRGARITALGSDGEHAEGDLSVPGRGDRRTRLTPGEGPLSRVPPPLAFLVVIALFLLGAWLGGWIGVTLLSALILLVLGLLLVTWRTLTPGERALRVITLLMLIVITATVGYNSLAS
ncbi:hypothetical protein UA75_24975 [Actinoalloteichus sp. GBA129-24]|nr:hypothetical protein UA75_24975 [Actinoalloteichus sp. GBA129-24]